jgi:hypothetical protein
MPLTEKQEYIILDTLNEPLQAIAYRVFALSPNPFALLSIDSLRLMLSKLPETRIQMISEMADSLASADQSLIQEAIGGKRRLIKADILEWSDNPAFSQAITIAGLKNDIGAKLRAILGLPAIALLLQQYGLSNNSATTQLKRS